MTAKSVIRDEVRRAMLDRDREARVRDGLAARTRCLEIIRTRSATRIMAYLADPGEIDLDPTIQALLEDDRIEVAAPVVSLDAGRMTCGRLRGLDAAGLVIDRYGLRSPAPPVLELDPASLDVVLVPGVAFARDGRRLGRGGGYYDRFLAALPSTVHLIGICHSRQVRDDLPSEAHDVRVHQVMVADEA